MICTCTILHVASHITSVSHVHCEHEFNNSTIIVQCLILYRETIYSSNTHAIIFPLSSPLFSTHIHVHTHTHTHTYTHTHTHTHTYTHTHTHVHTYIHIHTHIAVRTHTHIHTHPYAHTQTHTSLSCVGIHFTYMYSCSYNCSYVSSLFFADDNDTIHYY